MISSSQRNRRIKQVLARRFGHSLVSVTSGRGTSRAWMHVKIKYAPRDAVESFSLYDEVRDLISSAGTDLSHYWPDDGSGDRHDCLSIQFSRTATSPVVRETGSE